MTIKELRAARMMTQSQLADRIGIETSDLEKYENGKKKVPASVLLKIRDTFGVEIDKQDGIPAKSTVKKIQAPDIAVYIQSPLGGNITPEEIRAMVPKDAKSCYVRVDQNKIWWTMPDETIGFAWIWE